MKTLPESFTAYLNILITISRERNRVHARNTRERKKSQMDGLQSRIQELVDEVKNHYPTVISTTTQVQPVSWPRIHFDEGVVKTPT